METPKVGQLIKDGERRRDAIHVAIAPVTAYETLIPGEKIGFVQQGDYEHVGACRNGADKYAVGIVDPYLTGSVLKGERFYLFLSPGTVTSLRHVWNHPQFGAKAVSNG